jgi:hypothetical protein
VPRWIGSVGLLAGVYAVVMTATVFWMPHEWDWHVLNLLSSGVAPAFSPDVVIVDLDWSLSDIASDRRRISDFIDGLVRSDRRPSALILDVEFLPCQTNPCAGPMAFADAKLVASIARATRRFPIYATEEPQIARDDAIVGPLDPQDTNIYGVLNGAGQTRFTSIPNARGLFYRLCYAGVPLANSGGEFVGAENVWAMVARVLMTPRFFAASPACDQTHIPVRLGSQGAPGDPIVYSFTAARTFQAYAQLDETYVIAGTIKYDRLPFVARSGPEVLGWALSNALEAGSLVGKTPYYDVQPQNARLLLLVPVFSALTVLAYVAIFLALRRVRLRGFRYVSPWISAALAIAVGVTIVIAFELAQLLARHIAPQVSLILFGVAVAGGLSGVRGRQILREESEALEAAPAEVYDYDVFISYARQDRAWVFEHVFVPFRDARLPNGRRLSVFFDAASIRSGTQWQAKIALAVDESRFIVPVYSDSYFKQPYCRFEIMRAHRKWISAGEESRCVLPVMLGHPTILRAVDDIQAASIDDDPDIVAQHIAEVVARLTQQPGATGAPQEAGSA